MGRFLFQHPIRPNGPYRRDRGGSKYLLGVGLLFPTRSVRGSGGAFDCGQFLFLIRRRYPNISPSRRFLDLCDALAVLSRGSLGVRGRVLPFASHVSRTIYYVEGPFQSRDGLPPYGLPFLLSRDGSSLSVVTGAGLRGVVGVGILCANSVVLRPTLSRGEGSQASYERMVVTWFCFEFLSFRDLLSRGSLYGGNE